MYFVSACLLCNAVMSDMFTLQLRTCTFASMLCSHVMYFADMSSESGLGTLVGFP